MLIGIMFLGVNTAKAQDVTLTLPSEIKGKPGDTVLVEIKTSDLTGKGVNNFDFEFKFDGNFIKFEDGSVTPGSMLSGGTFVPGYKQYETVKIGFIKTSPLSGSGTLFTLKGVLQTVNTDSLSSDSLASDSTFYTPPSDSSTSIPGNYNPNGVILQEYILGDGSLDVSPSAPVSIPVTVSNAKVSLPNVTGYVGDIVDFTITNTDIASYNIVSYELEFTYDTSVVSFSNEPKLTGTVSQGGSVSVNTTTAGKVVIAGVVIDTVGTGTNLLTLAATLKDTAASSKVTFTKAEFFGTAGASYSFIREDGSVSVEPASEKLFSVTFNAYTDVADGFNSTTDDMYISGDFVGWTQPGSNANYKMSPVPAKSNGDAGIYTITLMIKAGSYNYKYFAVPKAGPATWDKGEWAGDPNRTITVTGDETVNNLYSLKPNTSLALKTARTLQAGAPVSVTGVVTSPDFGYGGAEFFIQDSEGGIAVYYSSVGGEQRGDTPFAAGQNITINGSISSFNDNIQILPTSYVINSTGNALPEPIVIDNDSEWSVNSPYMGMLVKLTNVYVVEGQNWPVNPQTSSSGVSINLKSNLTDKFPNTYQLRIDRGQSELDGSEKPAGAFNISGVLSRFRTTPQMFPFRLSDIGVATSNELNSDLPTEFTLEQNYPNPFNPATTIKFALPEAADVKLEVFNVVGQKVATLVNAPKNAGYHVAQFDASGLSSGLYLYKISAGNFVQVKSMMLIK